MAQVSADISISVVSHSQIVLVAELLNDLACTTCDILGSQKGICICFTLVQ